MAFIFYDTETTGLDKHFDQILQFAAIKTDADLNELDRFEIRCRLRPNVVPSPGAMRVTGTTVARLTDPSLPSHYDMMRAICDKLASWSPAIVVGYNSLDFDENFLRQAFYQTLHSPYLTQAKGNGRADVMDLVQCVGFFHPGILSIPTDSKGKPSFKLDRVAPANGFDHANAHDAVADVEATIHLAKIVRDKAPEAWSTFTRFSQKASVVDFVGNEPAFVLTEHYFGKPYAYAVTLIEFDQDQSALAYVLDLSVDLNALAVLDDVKLASRLKASPKAIRRLKSNAAPFLTTLDDLPDHLLGRLPSREMLQAQHSWVAANRDVVAKWAAIYRSTQKEYEPSTHVEQMIYDAFLTHADQEVLDIFHVTPWPDRLLVVEKLTDARFKTLGRRLIHAERPELLPPDVRAELDVELANRLRGRPDGSDPWLTLHAALVSTNDLLKGAGDGDISLLTDLAAYLSERIETVGKH